jgi:integrase
MTFYESGRHSFVSRTLSRGASLDEVSAAVGHSSPMVTKRYYDHFVRKTFSPVMREGVGAKQSKGKGKVIQMKAKKSEG